MKNRKTILSVFLAVLMLALAAPLAFGAETVNSGTCGDLTWTLDSEGTLTLSGEGSMYPETHDEDNYCSPFEHSSEIKNVVIESGVTEISERAFNDCREIKSITIPDSVVSIGKDAFHYNASLESITVSEDNRFYSAEDNVLFNKDKTELIVYSLGKPDSVYSIPDTVLTIDSYALSSSPTLQTINISKSVTTIGDMAFHGCFLLNALNVDENNTSFSSADGVLFNKDQTVLIAFPCRKQMDEYVVPSSVTKILSGSFGSCDQVNSVIIPNSVVEIEPYAFDNSHGLKYVELPSNIASIDGVFRLCYSLKTIIVPNSVTSLGVDTFYDCLSLTSVLIPESITSIGISAFLYCNRLTDVYYTGDEEAWNSIDIDEYNDELKNANIHFNFDPDSVSLHKVTYDCTYNGGYWATETLDYIWENQNIDLTPSASKYESEHEWEFIGWNTDPNAKEGLSSLTMGTEDITLYAIFKDPFEEPTKNVYNLGEETYSFQNFGDADSAGGHCFGMSMTSAGYYLDILDISKVGGSAEKPLYSLPFSETIKPPICYYQAKQGTCRDRAMVAGGSVYKGQAANLQADWNEVVNYVKSHAYDDTGSLQIGFRGTLRYSNGATASGGHAINFLRYSVVDGQERIYAYDNNFPNVETYFYQDESGNVIQAPYATFNLSINCIALRDISRYFNYVGNFDPTHVFYAKQDEISIDGSTATLMEGDVSMGEYIMYEIPADQNQVVITPKTDNATFTYLDQEYQFGKVDEDTVGIFTLSTSESGTGAADAAFAIENAPETCPWCGEVHEGFAGFFTAFFHKIAYFFAHLFGKM